MLHAHVVGRDGREGRQTCKWQWTELTYVSSRMLTSAAHVLSQYRSLRSGCPVESEEAHGGIDGPASRAPGSVRRTKTEAYHTVSSRAGLNASRSGIRSRVVNSAYSDLVGFRASEMTVCRHPRNRSTVEAQRKKTTMSESAGWHAR